MMGSMSPTIEEKMVMANIIVTPVIALDMENLDSIEQCYK